MPTSIHLTVPNGFRKQPPAGVRLHRQDLTASDVTERDGYLITTPLRTLLDAAAVSLGAEQLAAAAQDALALGLVRKKALEEAIEDSPITSRRSSSASPAAPAPPARKLTGLGTSIRAHTASGRQLLCFGARP